MNLEEKLLYLRKSKHLSQEELADKLNVTRQTVSKWETGQSTPDFDKLIPLCELYEITPNELLGMETPEEEIIETGSKPVSEKEDNTVKRALGICIGILLYFMAVAWIVISIPSLRIDPVLSSGIFMIIAGFATFSIVFSCIVFKKKKVKEDKKENKLFKQITGIISLITLIIYLLLSFVTMAWYITWIIWIVYALVEEILRLVFYLKEVKGEKNEE